MLVLEPKTVWMAWNLPFRYMYLSTKYAYNYVDWSSYSNVWDLVLPLLKLHTKLGICGA